MAVITVKITTQTIDPLPAVGSELFVTLLTQNHRTIDTCVVDFNEAAAVFDSLQIGTYIVVVRNPMCSPTEVQHTCQVARDKLYDLNFVYSLAGKYIQTYAY
ncbi:MAG: hypothetical protein Fur006_29070 [Coleofasciculaceae cyanobacterium]